MTPTNTTPAPNEDNGRKLPYTTPKLTVHGDLRAITAVKGGNRDEAGQPKTFTSGKP